MTDTSIADAPSPTVEACKRDRLKMTLATGSMGYLIFFTGLLFFKGLPAGEAGGAATMLGGVAAGLVKDAFGFVFGSSAGSEAKSDQITQALAQPKAAS